MVRQRLARESSNERHLRKRVKQLGGLTFKLTFLYGICDDLVLLRGGRLIFMELKRPEGGRISPMQEWWVKKLRELGFRAEIANTTQLIDEVLGL